MCSSSWMIRNSQRWGSRYDEEDKGYLYRNSPPTVTESYVIPSEFLIKILNNSNVKGGTDLENAVWQRWRARRSTFRV